MRRTRLPGARRNRAPELLLSALFGWILLWALTNPPGTAPDEPSHYAKVVAAGHGDIVGATVPFAEIQALRAFNEDSLRQVRNAYRSFLLPTDLRVTTNPPCTALHLDASATCLRRPAVVPNGRVNSIVGAYPPWLYIPAGVLTRAAWSVQSGYVLARLGSAFVSAGLLGAGLWLLLGGQPPDRIRSQRPLLLAGFAVAVTPMVLFLSSQAGTSGAEVTGAIASIAAVLRLSRAQQPTARTWLVAGAVLATTALSRPLAPLWVAFAITIGIGRLGGPAVLMRVRGAGRPAAAAVTVVGAGIAATVLWTQALSLRTPVLWGRLGHGLAVAIGLAPQSARQAVGVFGWQSIPIPGAVYWLWGLLAAGLFLAAFALGGRRDRALLAGSLTVVVAGYELLAAAVFIQNGFGMQGRYVLPALVMLPLLSVEVLADRLPARLSGHAATVATGVIAMTAVSQFVAWVANSRRYAVGVDGPLWFVSGSAWSPSGGWLVWLVLACLPVMMTFAAARSSAAVRPDRPHSPGAHRHAATDDADDAENRTTQPTPPGNPGGMLHLDNSA
ncbi:DUF2142 domain-containing protein [Frankia sp. Cas3]|uniref:DUF2142 domain-containing protein n=1 Tax=Frankia sp. Cas3 TaxID=3073926 RepID=UPI002AD53A4D|nr:DUF2142 domain-containing protein [Frankia sp. Cas3]